MKSKDIRGTLSLDHPDVQKIIEIAKDLIKQNKVVRVKKLYNIAVRSLKIPSECTLEIIHFLNNNKIIIDGSRHTRDTILLNLYRNNIYKVIYHYNGATFTFLKENVFTDQSGSPGQLIWHLKMLLKFKYIKKIKIGNYSFFLPIEVDEDFGKLCFFMKDDLNRKIIELFMSHEKIKKPQVYKMVDYKRENVNYRLKILMEHQILTYVDQSTKEIGFSNGIKDLLTGNLYQKQKVVK